MKDSLTHLILLVNAAEDTRKAQVQYFKSRDKYALTISKRNEEKLDQIIDEVNQFLGYVPKPQQQTLDL